MAGTDGMNQITSYLGLLGSLGTLNIDFKGREVRSGTSISSGLRGRTTIYFKDRAFRLAICWVRCTISNRSAST